MKLIIQGHSVFVLLCCSLLLNCRQITFQQSSVSLSINGMFQVIIIILMLKIKFSYLVEATVTRTSLVFSSFYNSNIGGILMGENKNNNNNNNNNNKKILLLVVVLLQ